MSGSVTNVKVQPCRAIWGGVDFGLTSGDIEVKPKEEGVEVKAHQEGSNVLDKIRTGKSVSLNLTLMETSLAQVQAALAAGGGSTGAVAEIAHLTCVADVADSLHGKCFPLVAKDGTKFLFQLHTSAISAPVIPGWTVVQVSVTTGDTANTVADSVAAAIDALAAFTAPNPAAAIITITQASTGIVASGSTAGNTGFTYAVVTPGTNLLTGWGKSRDFTGMLGDSAKLVLHPVVKSDVDLTEDLAFWKAYPLLDSIKKSGEKENLVTVTFDIFPDTSKDDAVRLFALGDHS